MSIVGVDEVDLNRNQISWMSPLARALMKSGPGDSVVLHAPGRTEQLEILDVRYEHIPVEAFSEPPGAESARRRVLADDIDDVNRSVGTAPFALLTSHFSVRVQVGGAIPRPAQRSRGFARRTPNREPEPNAEPEHEPRSENAEV